MSAPVQLMRLSENPSIAEMPSVKHSRHSVTPVRSILLRRSSRSAPR